MRRIVNLLPPVAILLLAGALALEGWARHGVALPALLAVPIAAAAIAWCLHGRRSAA